MGAAAERDVPVAAAVEAHLVGVLEPGASTLPAPMSSVALVAGAAHDAADLDVLEDLARHHHHRRLVPQQLLDRNRHELGIVDERLPAIGMSREVGDHAVEGRGHGVEPTSMQQMAGTEQLGGRQRPALDLGAHEHAEQAAVVGSVAPFGEPRSKYCVMSRPVASRISCASAIESATGRIVSSRHFKKRGRSDCGSPIKAMKNVDGSGVANSSWKSHSPRSMKASITSSTSLRISGSSSAIFRR